MCLDNIGFFVDGTFLLLLTQLLDQSHGLPLQTTTNLTANTAGEQLHKLLIVHVKKLVKIDTSVSELTEGPLFLQLCGSLKIMKQDSTSTLIIIYEYSSFTNLY